MALEQLQRENDRLQKVVGELRLLNEISSEISALQKPEEITDMILKKCIDYLEAEQGCIWLVNQENELQQPQTFLRIMDEKYGAIPFQIGATIVGWVLKFKGQLLSNDFRRDTRISEVVRSNPAIKSLLAVPLTLQNRVIGVLCLFNKQSEEGFTEDDGRMLSIVAIQSAQTLENARLHVEEMRLRDLEEEYRMARVLQQTLLPRSNPQLQRFEVVGTYRPANLVGGDYFDFVTIDEDHLGVAIADVAGKGMPAALVMASLQACLRGQALQASSPAEVVTKINTMFCRFLETGRFITLLYGVLNLRDNSFTFCNAGHCYPVKMSANGSVADISGNDLVVGVNEPLAYSEQTVGLEPGEILLLYTDGLTDAIDSAENCFGEIGILESFAKQGSFTAAELVQTLLSDVESFQGSAPQFDDITIVAMKAR